MKKKKPNTGQLKLGLLSDLDSDIFIDGHDEIMLWVDKNIENILKEIFPNYLTQKWRITSKEWEKPITTNSKDKRLLGFTDLFVKLTEQPSHSGPAARAITFVEVKTRIRPGPDIRQVNAYRTFLLDEAEMLHGYESFSVWPSILVSSDLRYEMLLKKQGIRFFPYDPNRWSD